MIRIATSFAVTVLLMGPFCASGTRAQGSEEIVIADEIRTAFYEHAPRDLVAEMSKAVTAWCSSEHSAPGFDAVSWLCRGGSLTYYRNVYISGERGPHGLVCDDYGSSTFRYLGMDLAAESIGRGSCVRVECYESAYEPLVEEVSPGDA